MLILVLYLAPFSSSIDVQNDVKSTTTPPSSSSISAITNDENHDTGLKSTPDHLPYPDYSENGEEWKITNDKTPTGHFEAIKSDESQNDENSKLTFGYTLNEQPASKYSYKLTPHDAENHIEQEYTDDKIEDKTKYITSTEQPTYNLDPPNFNQKNHIAPQQYNTEQIYVPYSRPQYMYRLRYVEVIPYQPISFHQDETYPSSAVQPVKRASPPFYPKSLSDTLPQQSHTPSNPTPIFSAPYDSQPSQEVPFGYNLPIIFPSSIQYIPMPPP